MTGRSPRRQQPGPDEVPERSTFVPTPARRYRWRDFGEDRRGDPVPDGGDYAASVSTRHGALSERKIDPIAATLAAELLADRPDLQRYPEAVAAWARAESRCLVLESWIMEHGLLDGDGKATASERLLASSERLAMQFRDRLGLDPKSEAELAKTQAEAARSVVDVDALRARGREALERRRELESAERLRDDDAHLRHAHEAE